MDQPPQVIARDSGVLGEVALRRRFRESGPPVHELIVNGVFLMDTLDFASEDRLAEETLRRLPDSGPVLVAGLGFGFTAATLSRDRQVTRVDVVEIEPLLVHWLRQGLVPETTGVLNNPRVRVHVADVQDYVAGAGSAAYIAIVLDVDNGPGFLVHEHNAPVYGAEFLAAARRVLRPGGLLSIWSMARAPSLRASLAAELGPCDEIAVPVERDGRSFNYYLYVAVASPAGSEPVGAPAGHSAHKPRHNAHATGFPRSRP